MSKGILTLKTDGGVYRPVKAVAGLPELLLKLLRKPDEYSFRATNIAEAGMQTRQKPASTLFTA